MTKQRPNTPKSDLWRETVFFINNFQHRTDSTGVTVMDCIAEHQDLVRLVRTGYGSPEGETQVDRDAEIEGCIEQEDFQIILDFYQELGKKVKEIKALRLWKENPDA